MFLAPVLVDITAPCLLPLQSPVSVRPSKPPQIVRPTEALLKSAQALAKLGKSLLAMSHWLQLGGSHSPGHGVFAAVWLHMEPYNMPCDVYLCTTHWGAIWVDPCTV